jgi:iron complex outermembrane recepter protein
MIKYHKSLLGTVAFVVSLVTNAFASNFNIPAGDLKVALDAYAKQTGVALIYPAAAVKGSRTSGAEGDLSADDALLHILTGTGFIVHRESGAIAIVRGEHTTSDSRPLREAAAVVSAVSGAALETVTVTSSKIGGDVQNIPIAVTAMSQEQLTATQTAGGPDLVKQVPNLTFSKTNFTGYNIQIRGIGTQAISVTTDPAVAVAFNDTPFIRNHFFEQEFYDVSQVQVLRGPQGTLYGRNATAGVVNLTSAKPADQFEALASVDVSNYHGRRLEAMVNLPIVDDRLDIRVAGELTKRDGYSFNETTNEPIDGRGLWSSRVTIGFKPVERVQTYLIWEHFQEGDDRMRSAKQLCKRDPGPSTVGVVSNIDAAGRGWLSQTCLPTSFYAPTAYETPNGNSLPYVLALQYLVGGAASTGYSIEPIDPYLSTVQSPNLRTIQSEITPTYKVSNDVVEFNADYDVTPMLRLTSQTGYNHDRLASTEDFNRFNTASGVFSTGTVLPFGNPFTGPPTPNGIFCDPQLGCSSKLVGEDLSQERAWQLSQEFRLASNFSGPLNFNVGGNYLHYETLEDYYVFINFLTLFAQGGNQVGLYSPNPVGDFTHCSGNILIPHAYQDPANVGLGIGCTYIDTNPLIRLDGNGHNYFRSQNPYVVNSYAGFGEAYYQVIPDLKLTAGLRWTDDQKHFIDIPSWVATSGWGYPITDVVDQQWKEFSGRFVANWAPKLEFTDQSMFYASYSRGYKGGGANPPGPAVGLFSNASESTHPLTFAPEFNNAYEIGTKNTLADGTITLNGDAFFYDYKAYQISEIIDRTSINLNIDATVRGVELESTWEPIPGLRFNLSSGYEKSRINNGQSAVDLIDRTAGHTDWIVVKPFISATSNCILPITVVSTLLSNNRAQYGGDNSHPITVPGINDLGALNFACFTAYNNGTDPSGTGFDPATAPNGGAGFAKNLGGNDLPNTPHVTLSIGAQYTMSISSDWGATLRGDYYYQADSWARIFNDNPYDHLRGYTNLNLALILTSQDGWQVMGYMKNVFNTTAITGAFLNSDDTGLTTNVFVTDPRLFGVRLTKNW